MRITNREKTIKHFNGLPGVKFCKCVSSKNSVFFDHLRYRSHEIYHPQNIEFAKCVIVLCELRRKDAQLRERNSEIYILAINNQSICQMISHLTLAGCRFLSIYSFLVFSSHAKRARSNTYACEKMQKCQNNKYLFI